MRPIFISYRRDDSADVTGRIYDRLREKFGPEAVSIDVDNIPFGVDYRDHLDEQVSKCDVFLAVIGKDWLTIRDADGKPRLEDLGDVVRIEIESALKRDIPIVPLFVRGAEMPSEHELPESLRKLPYLNGLPVRRDPDFHNDLDRLTNWLKEHFQSLEKTRQLDVERNAAEEAERLKLAEIEVKKVEAQRARLAAESRRKALEARRVAEAQQADDAKQKAEENLKAREDAEAKRRARVEAERQADADAKRIAEEEKSQRQEATVKPARPGGKTDTPTTPTSATSKAIASRSKVFKLLSGAALLLVIGTTWFAIDAWRSAQIAAREAQRPADEAETQRIRDEEARLETDAEEAQRLVDEAQAQRIRDEEATREADDAEAQRLANEAEAKRVRDAEAQRLANEAEARRVRDAEAQRLANEAEARRIRDAEAQRLADEAEAQRQAEAARQPLLPKMVVIPGGQFTMGSPTSEKDRSNTEGPQRQVNVPTFAIGKYEVTFAEYDRCTNAGYCPRPEDDGSGRGSRPVVNVSWDDAVAYANWLSQVSGNQYRLPTEAEWEYAAKGGGVGQIWAGTSRQSELGAYAWYADNSSKITHIVGEKLPNGLGLHDMSGNVWEWVQDCWHGNYRGAPRDGSAWMEARNGECGNPVARGGSWFYPPFGQRTASRFRSDTGHRGGSVGFRLAQDQ